MHSSFHRIGLYVLNFVMVLIDLLYFYLFNGCHKPGLFVVTELLHNWPTGDYRMFLLDMVNVIILNENHAFHEFLNIAFFWDVMPCNLLDMY